MAEEKEPVVNDKLLDMGFWVNHCGECVCLNFCVKGREFSSPSIDRTEWIEWLREELKQCHPASVPAGITRAFMGATD